MTYRIVFGCSCSNSAFLDYFYLFFIYFLQNSLIWSHPYQVSRDPLHHWSFPTYDGKQDVLLFWTVTRKVRAAQLLLSYTSQFQLGRWLCSGDAQLCLISPSSQALLTPPCLLCWCHSGRWGAHSCWCFSLDQESTYQVTVPWISSYHDLFAVQICFLHTG